MGRVINTNEPDKRRKHEMRTIAEILRRISQKPAVDDESKDMASAIVFSLRVIAGTVEESVRAWEKLNYWKKADDFQEKWWWAPVLGKKLEELIRAEKWDELPAQLMKLLPYFADIEITKFTRAESEWNGRYDALIGE